MVMVVRKERHCPYKVAGRICLLCCALRLTVFRFFGFIEVLLWGTRVMEVQHHDTGHAGGPAAQSQRARTTRNGPVARERHVAKARGVGKRYMYGALATCLSRVSVHCALFAPSGSVPRALQRALCHGVALP